MRHNSSICVLLAIMVRINKLAQLIFVAGLFLGSESLLAEKYYVSTRTGGSVGGVSFKNEDILQFDSNDQTGGANGTWSLFFDGSDVGLGPYLIDGFYITDDFLLLSFNGTARVLIDGRKVRVNGADIVKFNPLTLGENTSGTFERYFDGSDVGLQRNIDALTLDPDGNLIISTGRKDTVRDALGNKFAAHKQDLIKFTGSTGADTAGSFELVFDGSKAGLARSSENIDGVDTDGSFFYLTTSGGFNVGSINGKRNDIFRCDLLSLPIEICGNPEIIFTGDDLGLAGENIVGIQLDLSINAADDSFTTDQNTVIAGAQLFADNGNGADSDAQNDPFTVTEVNASAANVGVQITLSSGALLTVNADGTFTYDPNGQFDDLGGSEQGQDHFSYQIGDGNGDFDTATVTINITGENDAPSDIALSGAGVAENQPSGAVTGDFTTSDVDTGDTHSYTLVTGTGDADNNSFLIVGDQLQTAATFDFETKASYSIRVHSTDGGGLSTEKQFTIAVTNANDAPTDIVLSSAIAAEGQPIGTAVGDFSSVDIDVSDTHTYELVTGAGDTDNGAFQIEVNQLRSAAIFNEATQSSFSIRVRSTDSGSLSVEKQFTITVASINHAPIFAKGADQTVNEDSGPVTVSPWATAIDDGDAAVTQTLAFNVTGNDNPGLFSVAPAIDATTGNLTFTPAPNANGAANITIVLTDDGGTANGGVDTSAPQSFTITVNPVNDTPSFAKGPDQTVNEDAGAQSVAGWATSISAGPSDESGQTLTFNVTGNTNPVLFSAGPTVAPDGTLGYTPAANASGSASITLALQDNGGTAIGGADTSGAQSFTINVTAVDDPPVAVNDGATVNEDSGANALDVLANDTDIDGGPKSVASVTQPANGTVVITGGGTGLSYQPNANYCNSLNASSVDSFTYTLTPGVSSAMVTVTVNCVNDPPVAQTQSATAQANMKITGLGGTATLTTGVTDADNGISGCSPSFSVASIATGTGGTVSNVNLGEGTFDFEPNAGFTGTATATYTVSDNGCPGSATSAAAAINITVSGPVIWFVDDSASVGGDGRLGREFQTVGAATSAIGANTNHKIFVYSGNYTQGATLNTDGWLIGQGTTGSFDSLFGITPPAGTLERPGVGGARPTLANTVTLGANSQVKGLNISSGATTGIVASGKTGLVTSEVSVTTSNAAAVNLSSSGGTISLTSVSANGGSNGIVLNNTTGTFTVTGTGGTCTDANTSGCTGGTVQNTTGGDDSSVTPVGTGIVLNNAAGVSLTRMYVHDHSNYGIRGTGVSGFTLDTSVVGGVNGTNVASPYSDGSLSFDNLAGTSAIANSAVSGGYQRNIRVDNTSGTLNLTVSGSSIHNTGSTAGDDGLFVEIGGGNATLNVTNNTFSAHGGDHFNLSLLGSPTVDLTFTGNSWTGGHAIGLGQGLFILAASFNSPGTFTYDILNNGTVANPLVGNNSGGAIHVNKGSGTGTFSGTISNNVIGNPAVNGSGSLNGSGIDVEAHGSSGSHTTVISNNQVRQFHNDGILILAGEGNAALNATVTGNTVTNPDNTVVPLHGMHFNIGTLPADNMTACLDVKNNSLAGAGADGDNGTPSNGGVDLRMRQRQLTTVRLPGYGGSNNDNAAVQTFLTTTNVNAVTTIFASNTVPTGGGFVGGAACPQP